MHNDSTGTGAHAFGWPRKNVVSRGGAMAFSCDSAIPGPFAQCIVQPICHAPGPGSTGQDPSALRKGCGWAGESCGRGQLSRMSRAKP